MTSLRNIRGRIMAFLSTTTMLCLALAVLLMLPAAGQALTFDDFPEIAEVGLTERIVTDHYSGFAISGYDPVGYFAAGTAVVGLPQYEAIWKSHNASFSDRRVTAVNMFLSFKISSGTVSPSRTRFSSTMASENSSVRRVTEHRFHGSTSGMRRSLRIFHRDVR